MMKKVKIVLISIIILIIGAFSTSLLLNNKKFTTSEVDVKKEREIAGSTVWRYEIENPTYKTTCYDCVAIPGTVAGITCCKRELDACPCGGQYTGNYNACYEGKGEFPSPGTAVKLYYHIKRTEVSNLADPTTKPTTKPTTTTTTTIKKARTSVTFDPNGGILQYDKVNLSNPSNPYTKDDSNGNEITMDLGDISAYKEGYTFKGWHTSKSCENPIMSGTKKITGDWLVYYACYEESVEVPTPPESTVDDSFVPGVYYASENASYSGAAVTCGDTVDVKVCYKDGLCEVTAINNAAVNTTTKVRAKYLAKNYSDTKCFNNLRYFKSGTKSYSDAALTKDAKDIECGVSFSVASNSLGHMCHDGVCKIKLSGTSNEVYVSQKQITDIKPICSSTCQTSSKVENVSESAVIRICHRDEDKVSAEDRATCAPNYEIAKVLVEDTCQNGINDNCYKDYKVTCNYVPMPAVTATGSIVRSDGYGTISLQGKDNGNVGMSGYYVSSGDEPVVNSLWTPFSNATLKETVDKTAGTYFVWVKNDKNRISYPIMSKIYDPDTTTVASSMSVESTDGSERYTLKSMEDKSLAYNDGIVSESYVRLTNNLKNDSVLASFDAFTTAYEVNVTKDKIALYATLTTKDASYVDGYEPRTVNLNYGRNVALIKIVNKKGKERTYTFIINRVDERESNNLLKDIKLSSGKIDFNPYTTDYTVKVAKNTKSVSVNGILESTKASFVSGYEPRMIKLGDDQTSAVIKTISETGMVRSYVITFVKSDVVEEDVSKSVYLSSLSVPGTNLSFDKNTYNYTVTVGYEIENIPIYAFAESAKAKVTIKGDTNFRVGTNQIEITVSNNNKVKIYNIYIIRKESGLKISKDNYLNTLTIKGFNIKFDPNVLDYSVKIKRERSLLITATARDNHAEVYMYGNNDLTGFSIVKIKVIAENGDTRVYSINIEKDAYNKKLEIAAAVIGGLIIISSSIIVMVRNKKKKYKEYIEEV